ncbi:MAG: flavin reductase [Bacteroidota bacterium]
MEQHLLKKDIIDLERRFRTKLINSLSGFKSVNLVGTISQDGVTNLSIISSVVHIGADPALMGFIMRPVTVRRDTYNNILETGQYTFNHLNASIFKKAHQTSARYPVEVSEFEAAELTEVYSDKIVAPYVEESHIRIGLSFEEKIPIPINGTTLMIGRIEELFFPKIALGEDGYLDIEKAGSITSSSLDAYHSTQKLARLSYAKADRTIKVI